MARPKRRLQLAEPATGDESLIAHVQSTVRHRHHDRLSVATFTAGQWQTAHFGAADALEYEIGSVTKTFTASLLAIAIERGEVSHQTKVGELLRLGDSPSAALTLGDIATQTSGLPRLPLSPKEVWRGARAVRAGLDPYIATVPELVAQAAASRLGRAGIFNYSNLGFAVLGQALAAAADTSYSALVEERIAAPLGLSATRSAATVAELSANAATGFDARGRASAPWTMNAYGPAGNIRSTLADMMRFTQAQLDGSAPGHDATTPRVDIPRQGRIGYAWLTTPPVITWHNGMTGGFASFVGFHREREQAVVVLSNTAVSVDALALSLFADR